jgi:hypothetical protein
MRGAFSSGGGHAFAAAAVAAQCSTILALQYCSKQNAEWRRSLICARTNKLICSLKQTLSLSGLLFSQV